MLPLPDCPLCGSKMELVNEVLTKELETTEIFFFICPYRETCGWCSPTRETAQSARAITDEIILAIQMMRTVKSYMPNTGETQRLP